MASLTYFITLTTDSCGFKVLSMYEQQIWRH